MKLANIKPSARGGAHSVRRMEGVALRPANDLAIMKTLRGTISQLRRPNVPLRLPLFGHAEKKEKYTIELT